MDQRKRSATIELVDEQERVLVQGRYRTDTERNRQMLPAGRQHSMAMSPHAAMKTHRQPCGNATASGAPPKPSPSHDGAAGAMG